MHSSTHNQPLCMMLCMDEIGILSVYMQDVLEHPQYEPGNGKYLGKGTETQLTWQGYEQCDRQGGKEEPPLLTPCWYDKRHEDGDACQKDDEDRTWNQCLLDGLIDKVDVSMYDGIGNLR